MIRSNDKSDAMVLFRLWTILPLVLVIFVGTIGVYGHGGRLWEPPSRASMWRRGYNTTVNSKDNDVSCGGYTNHWIAYGGLCGVCGDPYQQNPRDHEHGGKYSSGIITRTYPTGRLMNVIIDLTANHGGYFEFKMCKKQEPSMVETYECMDKHKLKILNGDNGGYRYYVKTKPIGEVNLQLQLPDGLECKHCVLQWKYKTGTRWGCDPDMTCGKGKGRQEEYYGCSDIAIARVSSIVSHDPLTPPKDQPVLIPDLKDLGISQQSNTVASKQLPNNAPSPQLSEFYHHGSVQMVKIENQPIINEVREVYVIDKDAKPDIDRHLEPTSSLTRYFEKIIVDALLKSYENDGLTLHYEYSECIAVKRFGKNPILNEWCSQTCQKGLHFCPKTICHCDPSRPLKAKKTTKKKRVLKNVLLRREDILGFVRTEIRRNRRITRMQVMQKQKAMLEAKIEEQKFIEAKLKDQVDYEAQILRQKAILAAKKREQDVLDKKLREKSIIEAKLKEKAIYEAQMLAAKKREQEAIERKLREKAILEAKLKEKANKEAQLIRQKAMLAAKKREQEAIYRKLREKALLKKLMTTPSPKKTIEQVIKPIISTKLLTPNNRRKFLQPSTKLTILRRKEIQLTTVALQPTTIAPRTAHHPRKTNYIKIPTYIESIQPITQKSNDQKTNKQRFTIPAPIQRVNPQQAKPSPRKTASPKVIIGTVPNFKVTPNPVIHLKQTTKKRQLAPGLRAYIEKIFREAMVNAKRKQLSKTPLLTTKCKAYGQFRGNPIITEWCVMTCKKSRQLCPRSMCSDECRGATAVLPPTNTFKPETLRPTQTVMVKKVVDHIPLPNDADIQSLPDHGTNDPHISNENTFEQPKLPQIIKPTVVSNDKIVKTLSKNIITEHSSGSTSSGMVKPIRTPTSKQNIDLNRRIVETEQQNVKTMVEMNTKSKRIHPTVLNVINLTDTHIKPTISETEAENKIRINNLPERVNKVLSMFESQSSKLTRVSTVQSNLNSVNKPTVNNRNLDIYNKFYMPKMLPNLSTFKQKYQRRPNVYIPPQRKYDKYFGLFDKPIIDDTTDNKWGLIPTINPNKYNAINTLDRSNNDIFYAGQTPNITPDTTTKRPLIYNTKPHVRMEVVKTAPQQKPTHLIPKNKTPSKPQFSEIDKKQKLIPPITDKKTPPKPHLSQFNKSPIFIPPFISFTKDTKSTNYLGSSRNDNAIVKTIVVTKLKKSVKEDSKNSNDVTSTRQSKPIIHRTIHNINDAPKNIKNNNKITSKLGKNAINNNTDKDVLSKVPGLTKENRNIKIKIPPINIQRVSFIPSLNNNGNTKRPKTIGLNKNNKSANKVSDTGHTEVDNGANIKPQDIVPNASNLKCKAALQFHQQHDDIEEWCEQNCRVGFCPKTICSCKTV